MRIIVDNQIANALSSDSVPVIKEFLVADEESSITFRWGSLLEYLGQGEMFSKLPLFDQTTEHFQSCISVLSSGKEKEVIFDMYDGLFLENLNQIKGLPEIKASFFIDAIREQRTKRSFLDAETVLSKTLAAYEAAFVENPSHTMHDLILYLAWDRMCVAVSHLFNYQSADPKFIRSIEVLKECLVESYQHIAGQGRTSPSFYRLIEALFFYEMREEKIEKHTDAEWKLLSQSFPFLKGEEKLADLFYIDDAVVCGKNSSTCYLTGDTPDSVAARLALAQFMSDNLRNEVPGWNYILRPQKIIYQ